MCAPTAKAAVVKTACPDAFNGAFPRVAFPSLNVTVPVGIPLAVEVTVVVKVTVWPNWDGLGDEATLVVVAARFTVCTVCVSVAEVLPRRSVSPEYRALIACDPTASDPIEKLACPPLTGCVPRTTFPSRNVTDPVGDPTDVTVAVKVTSCPTLEGF